MADTGEGGAGVEGGVGGGVAYVSACVVCATYNLCETVFCQNILWQFLRNIQLVK